MCIMYVYIFGVCVCVCVCDEREIKTGNEKLCAHEHLNMFYAFIYCTSYINKIGKNYLVSLIQIRMKLPPQHLLPVVDRRTVYEMYCQTEIQAIALKTSHLLRYLTPCYAAELFPVMLEIVL